MRVSLCGKRWKLRYTKLSDCRGECDAPSTPNKEIRIDKNLHGEEELEVLIHEAMHAIDWRADEDHVRCAAADVARMLYNLGYRRCG
jgi:hypothetical protein